MLGAGPDERANGHCGGVWQFHDARRRLFG
jgi:hypothetical protein